MKSLSQKSIISICAISAVFGFSVTTQASDEIQARTDTDIGIYGGSQGDGLSLKANFETDHKEVLSPKKTKISKHLYVGGLHGLSTGTTVWTQNTVAPEVDVNLMLGGTTYNTLDLNVFDLHRIHSEVKTLGLNPKNLGKVDARIGRFGMTSMRDYSTGFAMGGLMFTGGDTVFNLVTDPAFQSAVSGRFKVARAVIGSQDGKFGIAFQPAEIGADYKHKLGEHTLSIGGDIGAWFSSHATPQITFDKRIALERINGGNVGVFYEHSNRWGGGESINVNRLGVSISAN